MSAPRRATSRPDPAARRRAVDLLRPPVQEHDERVDLGPDRAHRGDEAGAVDGERDAGLRLGGRPRRDQGRLEPVERAENRDALTLHDGAVRAVRLRRVVADPDHGEAGGPDRIERVLHPDGAVVERVVVRHVDHVDTGGLQRGERRRGGAEVEVLARHRLAAIGDRGLEIDHRDVGAGEHGRDRREHVRRIGEELRCKVKAMRRPHPRRRSRPRPRNARHPRTRR